MVISAPAAVDRQRHLSRSIDAQIFGQHGRSYCVLYHEREIERKRSNSEIALILIVNSLG